MRKIIQGNKWAWLFALALALEVGCAQGDEQKEVVTVGNAVNVAALTGQNLIEFHLNAGAQNLSLCIACTFESRPKFDGVTFLDSSIRSLKKPSMSMNSLTGFTLPSWPM